MTVHDVTQIVTDLTSSGISVWVDGGWCVDALVGHELREHGDLDIAVSRADEAALREWFSDHGYEHQVRSGESAWNFVVADTQGREVDVHVFEFDQHGAHVYGIEYPAESLTGRAHLGGIDVHCIAPEWMFQFKTSYEPAPKDLIDVQALSDKFGFEIPLSHRGE